MIIKLIESLTKTTFQYFTLWGLFIQFIYYLGYLQNFQFSILVMLIFISSMSIVLFNIYPGYYFLNLEYFKKNKFIDIDAIKSNNILFKVIDIVTHHLALIIFIRYYNRNIKRDNLMFFFVILLLYLLIFNPLKVYGLKTNSSSNIIYL